MAATTPADEIRAAAQKLRDLADSATPGPWSWASDMVGLGVETTAPGCYRYRAQIARVTDEYDRDEWIEQGTAMGHDEDDAAWIALMNPGLAEPLADWLEATAEQITKNTGGERITLLTGREIPEWKAALAVARALNGGDRD